MQKTEDRPEDELTKMNEEGHWTWKEDEVVWVRLLKSMLKLYILNLVLNTPPASAMPEGEVWRTSTKHTMTVIEMSSRPSEISSRRMKSLCEDTKPEKGLKKKLLTTESGMMGLPWQQVITLRLYLWALSFCHMVWADSSSNSRSETGGSRCKAKWTVAIHLWEASRRDRFREVIHTLPTKTQWR